MGAPDLIFELRRKGYSIRADGNYLDISPADLPPEVVQTIRQSKAEILAELQREARRGAGNPTGSRTGGRTGMPTGCEQTGCGTGCTTGCVHTGHIEKKFPANDSQPKPGTLQDRQWEARRQKVIVMLEAAPDILRAVYVDTDSDPHNAIIAVAIRNVATCEMLIPKAKYDPWRLLELVERHGATTH